MAKGGGIVFEVTADVRAFEQEIKKVNGHLDSLNKQFGKGSTFAQIGKLLAGGGAIAGIGLLTRALDQSSDALVKLAYASRQGGDALQATFAEAISGVPIIGAIISTFDNLIESVTLNKLRTKEWVEALKDVKKAMAEAGQSSSEYAAATDKVVRSMFSRRIIAQTPLEDREGAKVWAKHVEEVQAERDTYEKEQAKLIERRNVVGGAMKAAMAPEDRRVLSVEFMKLLDMEIALRADYLARLDTMNKTYLAESEQVDADALAKKAKEDEKAFNDWRDQMQHDLQMEVENADEDAKDRAKARIERMTREAQLAARIGAEDISARAQLESDLYDARKRTLAGAPAAAYGSAEAAHIIASAITEGENARIQREVKSEVTKAYNEIILIRRSLEGSTVGLFPGLGS